MKHWIKTTAMQSLTMRMLNSGAGGLKPAFRAKWQQFIRGLSKALTSSHNVAAHNLKLHIAVMDAWDKQTCELG